ncbi:helix-turn-helix transcriptional regulator [Roseomonas sp. CAU 1739]|uniref:helix-turn-helix domain-containing protein n=1 Tax=Roseomonas sp. CAU 1739 TaxID=3140364 RepID=UPI00325B95B7
MARGPEIADFPEKLRLALASTNLSRAQLAQAVGVDKSVVARWLNGALGPSDQSLTALTAGLGKAIGGFRRADWDLPMTALADRLGVAPVLPAAAASPETAYPFPRAMAATSGAIAHAEATYAALWLLAFPSPTERGRIFPFAIRIMRRPVALNLEIEYLNRILVDMHGPAFAIEDRLYGHMDSRLRANMGTFVLQGTTLDRALVLDGVLATRSITNRIFAVRVLAFRLSTSVEEAALSAAIARAGALYLEGFEERLPPAMRAAFQRPPSDMAEANWISLDADTSWAMGEVRRGDPACRHAIEALGVARSLFAEVLGTVQAS